MTRVMGSPKRQSPPVKQGGKMTRSAVQPAAAATPLESDFAVIAGAWRCTACNAPARLVPGPNGCKRSRCPTHGCKNN